MVGTMNQIPLTIRKPSGGIRAPTVFAKKAFLNVGGFHFTLKKYFHSKTHNFLWVKTQLPFCNLCFNELIQSKLDQQLLLVNDLDIFRKNEGTKMNF